MSINAKQNNKFPKPLSTKKEKNFQDHIETPTKRQTPINGAQMIEKHKDYPKNLEIGERREEDEEKSVGKKRFKRPKLTEE